MVVVGIVGMVYCYCHLVANNLIRLRVCVCVCVCLCVCVSSCIFLDIQALAKVSTDKTKSD